MDELPAEQRLSSRVCPHCGHPPDDLTDEETAVE
jgi:type II secretory ATPase GspE/PulE/Tfp pilus assembly ATPase PilB-like protein